MFIDVYFYGLVWSFDDLAHYNCKFLSLLYTFTFISIANCYLTIQWRIQGRGLGGPGPLLFLDQTEAQTAEKNFFIRPPFPLSQSLDLALLSVTCLWSNRLALSLCYTLPFIESASPYTNNTNLSAYILLLRAALASKRMVYMA